MRPTLRGTRLLEDWNHGLTERFTIPNQTYENPTRLMGLLKKVMKDYRLQNHPTLKSLEQRLEQIQNKPITI